LRREEAAATDLTMTDNAPSEGTGTTVGLARPEGGPGPATVMRELVQAELAGSDETHWLSRVMNNTIVQVVVLLSVVSLCVWWLQQGSPGQELEVESDEDAEPRRLLGIARQYEKFGELGMAEKKLAALQALLAGDPERTKYYLLVSRHLERLRKEQGATVDRFGLIDASLARAEKLAKTGKTAESRAIWQGIIDLYEDESAAEPYVKKARNALQRGETVKRSGPAQ
jgi:hypothetical protein